VTAPRNGSLAVLTGITAVSATKVWAVGTFHFRYLGHLVSQPFALRWNGKVWQKMPTLRASNVLAVTGSDNNIWAAGGFSNHGKGWDLVEHWNGRHWKPFPGHPQSAHEQLAGIAMLPGAELWAVGYRTDVHSLQTQTLIEHFGHGAWSSVKSMNPAADDSFAGVAAASPTAVWAVGTYFPGS
jgi:hypothetical protein